VDYRGEQPPRFLDFVTPRSGALIIESGCGQGLAGGRAEPVVVESGGGNSQDHHPTIGFLDQVEQGRQQVAGGRVPGGTGDVGQVRIEIRPVQASYLPEEAVPPVPAQSVWKNSPRFLSVRS
jgi:hypothetical protein